MSYTIYSSFESNSYFFISWISLTLKILRLSINVNMLIDFNSSCKRLECDVPKTLITCHNIYLVIYYFSLMFFLCK